jgi:hypothetical protein
MKPVKYAGLLILLVLAVLVWRSVPSGSPVGAEPAAPGSQSLSEIRGRSSLSAAFIDQVLAAAHSPVAGQGQAVYQASIKAGIDDAFVLAFFGHESTFGTAGAAVQTHSWGNLICTPGYPSCIGRYRSYRSFLDGLDDFLTLLTREYFPHGLTTVEQIIPVYAPSSENDVAGYIQAVESFVSAWRSGRVEV